MCLSVDTRFQFLSWILDRGLLLTRKLLLSFQKFYGHHHDVVNRYGMYVSQMTTNMPHCEVLCHFVLYFLRFTVFSYIFGIFKLFLNCVHSKISFRIKQNENYLHSWYRTYVYKRYSINRKIYIGLFQMYITRVGTRFLRKGMNEI